MHKNRQDPRGEQWMIRSTIVAPETRYCSECHDTRHIRGTRPLLQVRKHVQHCSGEKLSIEICHFQRVANSCPRPIIGWIEHNICRSCSCCSIYHEVQMIHLVSETYRCLSHVSVTNPHGPGQTTDLMYHHCMLRAVLPVRVEPPGSYETESLRQYASSREDDRAPWKSIEGEEN